MIKKANYGGSVTKIGKMGKSRAQSLLNVINELARINRSDFPEHWNLFETLPQTGDVLKTEAVALCTVLV